MRQRPDEIIHDACLQTLDQAGDEYDHRHRRGNGPDRQERLSAPGYQMPSRDLRLEPHSANPVGDAFPASAFTLRPSALRPSSFVLQPSEPPPRAGRP